MSFLRKQESSIYHCDKPLTTYNNELAWEEKDLIETYVKKREIKVVCAAITLAMEIEPTFKNVILATEKLCIEKEGYQNNHQEPLSLIDIENMGGKAGILNKLIKDKTWRQSGKKENNLKMIKNIFKTVSVRGLMLNIKDEKILLN